MRCPKPIEAPERRDVSVMFDGIAGHYDRLNRWLSLGIDQSWRRVCVRHLPQDRLEFRLLDLATGTADLLIAAHREYGQTVRGTGIDFSEGMLACARRKLASQGLGECFPLVQGDATRLGIADGVFDAITIGFGVRNFADVPAGLRETFRVLRPDGRLLVLEFSLPRQTLFRRAYLVYFRHILPRLGGWVSGDRAAYSYLNKTVETFPYGDAFCRLLTDAGFRHTTAIPLSGGIATLYIGWKQPPAEKNP